jgi:hypothetical protein
LAVILYEIFARKDPYEGENIHEVLLEVADKTIRKRPILPANVPEQINHIMIDCLQDEANQRPTFNELDLRLERVDLFDFEKEVLSPRRKEAAPLERFPARLAKSISEGRPIQPEHKDVVTVYVSSVARQTNHWILRFTR